MSKKITIIPTGTPDKGMLTKGDYVELMSRVTDEDRQLFVDYFEKYHQASPRTTILDLNGEWSEEEVSRVNAALAEAKERLNVSGKVFTGLMATIYYEHAEGKKNKYAAQDKYDKDNVRKFGIKLNKKTDAKLIEALDRSPNKQALIKQALTEYLEK